MRLSRVGIIVTLALSLLCVSLTANARPAGKGRIGWLVQSDLDRASREAFLHSLALPLTAYSVRCAPASGSR